APLHIVTRSRKLVTTLTEAVPRWEDRGWIQVPNATSIRALMGHIRARCAPTTIQQADGQRDYKELNEAGDDAKNDARNGKVKPAVLTIPRNFDLTGMKLSTMTQAQAYRGIQEKKKPKERRSTHRMIAQIRDQALHRGDDPPRPQEIWRGIRHKDIRKPVTDFLWKVIHNAYKCGQYWKNIPGYEDRQNCPTCGSEDSVEHILFRCKSPGQELIWAMAGRLWTRK
ncbi:hypothetical protein FOMPIDRAFT_1096896, partial [Fomitopsis schrenkii]